MSTVANLVAYLNADITNYEKNMQRAVDLSKKVAAGVAIVAGSMGLVAAAGVKMAAEMEQNTIAFTTMLGSGEKAKKFLDGLQEFANSTPFEFPELVASTRKLLAFGFASEQVIPMLTAIGDTASGLGLGSAGINRLTIALGQMQAKGKVSAGEMMQLAEAGVPAWEFLAKAIGTDIPTAMKLAENGAINSSQGINAILAGMQSRFSGMMANQSSTLAGLWSTLSDNAGMAVRILGEEIIDAFDLKNKLQGAIDWVKGFATTLKSSGISEALDKMIPPGLQATIVIVAGAIVGALVPAMIALGVATWAALAPLLPFIAAGAALAALAFIIFKNWDQIRNFFENIMTKAMLVVQIAWSAFKVHSLAVLFAIMKGMEYMSGWIPGWGDKIKSATASIGQMIKDETQSIADNGKKLLTEWKTVNSGMVDYSEDAVTDINGATQQIIPVTNPFGGTDMSIPDTKAVENMLSAKQDLIDKTNQMTMSQLEYNKWALDEEKRKFEETYKGKQDMLDTFSQYYDAKMKDITKQQAELDNQIKKSYKSLVKELVTSGDFLGSAWKKITDNMLDEFINMIIDMVAQASWFQTMMSWFGLGPMGGSGISIPGFADGGDFGPGPMVVGEEGPELLWSKGYGNVTSNKDLHKVAGGGAGDVNVKVDVINQSGQPVGAKAAQPKFDGKQYVVGVILEALENNTNGLRDVVGVSR